MHILLLLRRLRSLCLKELLIIFKDPANRLVLIIPVVIQSFIFGYAATYDLNYIPYVICDQSRSALSRDLAARLDGTEKFVRQATLSSTAEAEEWIYDGKALLALNIGLDFADRILSGRNADIQVILDGRNSTTAAMAQGYVAQIVAEWNARLGSATPASLIMRAWFNPQLETRWNIMPGMLGSLSIIQIMVLAALSVAREREQGTFDQMLVTPLSPWEILIGKAIPPIVVGLAQATFILAICLYWFHIPFAGSFADLYISLCVFTLSCAGIGLCISAISLNMQQALVYCFVTLLPMVLLSGLATPVSAMPEALKIATYANPLRFALVCVRGVYLEGATLADIAGNFVPMLGVAAVTLPLAGWLFRNRLS